MLESAAAPDHPRRRAGDREPGGNGPGTVGLDGDLVEGAEAIAAAMGGRWTARRVYRLIEAVKAGTSDAPIANIPGAGWTTSRLLISRWVRRKLDPADKLA